MLAYGLGRYGAVPLSILKVGVLEARLRQWLFLLLFRALRTANSRLEFEILLTMRLAGRCMRLRQGRLVWR